MSKEAQKVLKSIFTKLNRLKVFVIGDAMLDSYWIGQVERISPEAPVPVVALSTKESRPGGAANVALNCHCLGAEVHLFSIIGQDENGRTLQTLLENENIHIEGLLKSNSRVTTTKTRVLAKNQHVIRLDEEDTKEITEKEEHHFIDVCLRAIQIEAPDIVIFEDYNKGILKENVIQKIIEHCQHLGVLTAVDPKKSNFLAYKNVDIFKPNLKEIREGIQLVPSKIDVGSLKILHNALHQQLHHQITLLTLSEKGVYTQMGKEAHLFPAFIRNIADVSGAGDTVIAVAAMIYKVTKDIKLSAQISNLAGGLVCEEVGVVPISKSKLLEEAINLIKVN